MGLSKYNDLFLISHRHVGPLDSAGQFSCGISYMVSQILGWDRCPIWLSHMAGEDNNSCQLDIQPGILTRVPALGLSACPWQLTAGRLVSKRDYPKKSKAKESSCKPQSFFWFGLRNPWTSQQSIFLIQNSRGSTDSRRRKPSRVGILERRIDMKAIFVNQLL